MVWKTPLGLAKSTQHSRKVDEPPNPPEPRGFGITALHLIVREHKKAGLKPGAYRAPTQEDEKGSRAEEIPPRIFCLEEKPRYSAPSTSELTYCAKAFAAEISPSARASGMR